MKITLIALTLALSACGSTTLRMPDGSLHECRHYADDIVWWDAGDTQELTEICREIGVERMVR